MLKVYETERPRAEALKGNSPELEAGEIVSVVGPSGCGKATMLNCLSDPDSINAGTLSRPAFRRTRPAGGRRRVLLWIIRAE